MQTIISSTIRILIKKSTTVSLKTAKGLRSFSCIMFTPDVIGAVGDWLILRAIWEEPAGGLRPFL